MPVYVPHPASHSLITVPADAITNPGRRMPPSMFANHLIYRSAVSLKQQLIQNGEKGMKLAVRYFDWSVRNGRVKAITLFYSDCWFVVNQQYPDYFPPVVWTSESVRMWSGCLGMPSILVKRVRFAPEYRAYGGDGLSLEEAHDFISDWFVGIDCMPRPWQYPYDNPIPCPVHDLPGAEDDEGCDAAVAPAPPPPAPVAAPEVIDLDEESEDMDESEDDIEPGAEVYDAPPPPAYEPLPEYDPPSSPERPVPPELPPHVEAEARAEERATNQRFNSEYNLRLRRHPLAPQ
jgi:hypothetical protein